MGRGNTMWQTGLPDNLSLPSSPEIWLEARVDNKINKQLRDKYYLEGFRNHEVDHLKKDFLKGQLQASMETTLLEYSLHYWHREF